MHIFSIINFSKFVLFHHKYLFIFILSVMFSGCVTEPQSQSPKFITWESREIDTWASVWLIKHYISPESKILIRPSGSPTGDGIAFATPEAKYKKRNGKSTFELLVEAYKINSPDVNRISEIIRSIDVSPWANMSDVEARVVETAFRGMDHSFRPNKVPVSCYDAFFQKLDTQLKKHAEQVNWSTAITSRDCEPIKTAGIQRDEDEHIRLLDINNILVTLGKGKKVVFVDTRETAEYDETHIPGAINIKLRDIDPSIKSQFDDADLVVPYCIKDFRGYEVAFALRKIGVKNVATMKPYGLAGWRSYQLPIAGENALSEANAVQRLEDCVHGMKTCYSKKPG